MLLCWKWPQVHTEDVWSPILSTFMQLSHLVLVCWPRISKNEPRASSSPASLTLLPCVLLLFCLVILSLVSFLPIYFCILPLFLLLLPQNLHSSPLPALTAHLGLHLVPPCRCMVPNGALHLTWVNARSRLTRASTSASLGVGTFISTRARLSIVGECHGCHPSQCLLTGSSQAVLCRIW